MSLIARPLEVFVVSSYRRTVNGFSLEDCLRIAGLTRNVTVKKVDSLWNSSLRITRPPRPATPSIQDLTTETGSQNTFRASESFLHAQVEKELMKTMDHNSALELPKKIDEAAAAATEPAPVDENDKLVKAPTLEVTPLPSHVAAPKFEQSASPLSNASTRVTPKQASRPSLEPARPLKNSTPPKDLPSQVGFKLVSPTYATEAPAQQVEVISKPQVTPQPEIVPKVEIISKMGVEAASGQSQATIIVLPKPGISSEKTPVQNTSNYFPRKSPPSAESTKSVTIGSQLETTRKSVLLPPPGVYERDLRPPVEVISKPKPSIAPEPTSQLRPPVEVISKPTSPIPTQPTQVITAAVTVVPFKKPEPKPAPKAAKAVPLSYADDWSD